MSIACRRIDGHTDQLARPPAENRARCATTNNPFDKTSAFVCVHQLIISSVGAGGEKEQQRVLRDAVGAKSRCDPT